MSLAKDIVPVGHVENAADPPCRPVAQTHQPPRPHMDGNQFAQWVSVQAGNKAGDLQHNVRALMVRASTPMLVSDEIRWSRKAPKAAASSATNSPWNSDHAKEPSLGDRDFPEQVADGWSRSTCIRSQDSRAVRGLRTGWTHGCSTKFEDCLQRQYDGQTLDHMFMPYKTSVETMLGRRRINCARCSTAPAGPDSRIQHVSRSTASSLKTASLSEGTCRWSISKRD